MFETFVSWCWVFFQETQTGQPSDNFPWFFDLNPSFERNASRVDAFTSFIWRWNFLLFVFDVEYFSTNSNRPIKQQFPMVLRLVYILSTYCIERRCFYFFSFDGVYFLLVVSFVFGVGEIYWQVKVVDLWMEFRAGIFFRMFW